MKIPGIMVKQKWGQVGKSPLQQYPSRHDCWGMASDDAHSLWRSYRWLAFDFNCTIRINISDNNVSFEMVEKPRRGVELAS